jgi:PAS domain S-box-containing protein
MHDFHSIDEFLRQMEPRVRGSGDEGAAGIHDLLEQTVEELKVAVEELRVTQEEMVAGAARGLEERAGERAFRDAFTAAPFAMLLTDAAGVVEYANAAAGAMLGLRATDLPGKPLAVYVGEEVRRGFRKVLNDMAAHAAPRTFEVTLQPRARLPLHAEASVWPVFGEDGMKLAWRLADVTTRHAAEAETHEQAATLRAAIDSLPVGLAAMDRDGSVLLWNRAAGELLGWSEEEVAGRPNPAVPDESALDAVRGRAAAPPRVPASAERRDGTTLAVELELAPLVDAEGTVRGSVSLIRLAEAAGGGALHWPEREMRRVLLEGVTPGTLTDRLRDGITAGLHAGHLRPGDRLPSIRDAAQETGIDHRVMSAAYRRLAAMGLVEVRPRKGVRVAAQSAVSGDELGETAEWLAEVLDEASSLQVRVGSLADLVRRWTGSVPLRCACVDATEDGRVALCHEMQHQWGMEAVPVDPRSDPEGRRELGHELRRADLVVTTHYHAHALGTACAPQRKALVLARLNAGVVEQAEEWLERGPLTAVVADPAYGERLRALRGGERVHVVCASDRAAVEALDPEKPVLATLAAQQIVGRPLRLLVPTTHFVAPVSARAVARLLVRANMVPRPAQA